MRGSKEVAIATQFGLIFALIKFKEKTFEENKVEIYFKGSEVETILEYKKDHWMTMLKGDPHIRAVNRKIKQEVKYISLNNPKP